MCDHADIENILQQHPRQSASMVGLLHDFQKHFRYLPEAALRATADYLEVPASKVYAIATFYKAFSLTPRGEHRVRVCTGTACHVRGSGLVIEELEKALGVARGETTADMKHTLEGVNCVGACALAPVVMIDDEVHGAVTPASAPALLPGARN
ncbi:MAG: NADH-quinone oxidoreductase subunit NuoE [Pseudomonadota bacterium]